MKQLLSCLSLFTVLIIHAQPVEFCPKGADWYYDTGFFGTYSQNRKTYVSDTVVANRDCKQLLVKEPSGYQSFQYIHQSADSIFGWEKEAAAWDFLFKNTFQKGDSMQLFVRSCGSSIDVLPVTIYIDSVSTIMYGQVPVKKGYFTQSTSPSDGVIYDLFGPENGFFFKDELAAFDCPREWIQCYADSMFSQVSLFGGTCAFTPISISPNLLDVFRCTPNPTNGPVEITFGQAPTGSLSVSLFDMTGHLLKTKNIDSYQAAIGLDFSGFPAGNYILSIRNVRSVSNQRLVIGH